MSRSDRSAATLTIPVGVRDHVIGPEDAPITLVEYGDFQCPYCREAYPIVKQVQEQLGVNGTPTFFINGVRHNGSYDLATLLGALETA